MNSGGSRRSTPEYMTHPIRDTKATYTIPCLSHEKRKGKKIAPMYKQDKTARFRASRHVRAEAQAHPGADRGY